MHDPFLSTCNLKAEMARAFFQELEKLRIEYVIVSNVEAFSDASDSDIDFVVGEEIAHRFDSIAVLLAEKIGARIVQAIPHEVSGSYYTLVNQVGSIVVSFHPDVSGDYRRGSKLWMTSEELLKERYRGDDGLFYPCTKSAFKYYLIKRIHKRSIHPAHFARLKDLQDNDPTGCRRAIEETFSSEVCPLALKALDSSYEEFRACTDQMRNDLVRSTRSEGLLERAIIRLKELKRVIKRVIHPTGLIVAVLGTDGSGKSTLIKVLRENFSPAFRCTRYYHFRPQFGCVRSGQLVSDPHGLVPRSAFVSLGKIFYFLFDYVVSFGVIIVPAKIRSTLIVFDRYLTDAVVDPRRYRIPNRLPFLRVLLQLCPPPDIILIASAPPEVLLGRKSELDAQTAKVLDTRYRDVATSHNNAFLISTAGTLEEAICEINRVIIDTLEARVLSRIKS